MEGVGLKEFSRVLVTGGAGFIGSHLVEGLMLLNAYDKLKFMRAIYY